MTVFAFRAPGAGRERTFRHRGLVVPRGMLAIAKASRPERALNRTARMRAAAALEADLSEVLSSFQRTITIRGAEAGVVAGSAGLVFNAGAASSLEAQLIAVMGDHLEGALQTGAEIGLRHAPPALGNISPSFATEQALSWAERQGARRVVSITTQTQSGIQEMIARGLRDELAPVDVARRIGRQAGLLPRQVNAIENFRLATLKRLAPVPEALTPAVQRVVDQEVARYTERQLLLRGRTIAETEMQEAIMRGEQAFWDEAVASGAVDPDHVFKQWRTVFDDRVCQICFPLHGEVVPFKESFITLSGERMGPPAHPRCRCYLVYFEQSEAGARTRREASPGVAVPPLPGMRRARRDRGIAAVQAQDNRRFLDPQALEEDFRLARARRERAQLRLGALNERSKAAARVRAEVEALATTERSIQARLRELADVAATQRRAG